MDFLFNNEGHQNILLEDSVGGLAVQSNQHLIVHDGLAMILDPGGHKSFNSIFSQLAGILPIKNLKYIFLSHQDPDIVAALNGWLMTTDADAYCAKIWMRFIPHFGVDKYLETRLNPIEDEGCILDLNGSNLFVLPAHFLHSTGNFQVYDPISKILYSGDLGASIGADYSRVDDFDNHLQYMEGFHKRFMNSNKIMAAWAGMVRSLDIEIIAPQHGALFVGKEMVNRFIDWSETFQCGSDYMEPLYQVPSRN